MRLNLGCGRTPLEGWINADRLEAPGIDVLVDLDSCPWPFRTDAATHLLLDNVLEHLRDPLSALEEIHRIAEPGGRIRIVVPHWRSPGAYRPTHRTFWDPSSLDSWIDDGGPSTSKRGLDTRELFLEEKITVRHAHPWAWHQRKYLGRELVAWGPREIQFDLINRGEDR